MPPFGPVKPILQIHCVLAEDAATELELEGHRTQFVSETAALLVPYLPAPQLLHTAVPTVSLYLPAMHKVHGPPFGPEKPILQMQLASVLQVLQDEPELLGHVVQLHVPAVAAYAPTPQGIQTPVLPDAGL